MREEGFESDGVLEDGEDVEEDDSWVVFESLACTLSEEGV